MENFKVIIVEDVPLELKGTEGIFKNDIPEAEIIGTAESEIAYWKLIKQQLPDLVLLDLGLGGSTTVGVEICRQTKEQYPDVKVLIFTGEILNEKLWVDVLDAGCDGIILKSGELLTRGDVASCMGGTVDIAEVGAICKIVGMLEIGIYVRLEMIVALSDAAGLLSLARLDRSRQQHEEHDEDAQQLMGSAGDALRQTETEAAPLAQLAFCLDLAAGKERTQLLIFLYDALQLSSPKP